MLIDQPRFTSAAEYQTFSVRRGNYAFKTPALRIGHNASVNRAALGVLPINRTRTKRGFAPYSRPEPAKGK